MNGAAGMVGGLCPAGRRRRHGARLHERHFSVAAQGVLFTQSARGIDCSHCCCGPSPHRRSRGGPAHGATVRARDSCWCDRAAPVERRAGPGEHRDLARPALGVRLAAQHLRRQSEDELPRLAEELARSNGVASARRRHGLLLLCASAAARGSAATRRRWCTVRPGELDDEVRGYVNGSPWCPLDAAAGRRPARLRARRQGHAGARSGGDGQGRDSGAPI